jgi:arsenical pump membrane protein
VTVLVFVALAVLVGSVAWRPHGMGPAIGALAAVALAALGGAVQWPDVPAAIDAQWRAYVTLASVMTITSAAERMGLIERLAAIIEPRTRGPVRHAFRVTFALSAATACVLSNDAAILLMTPTVLVLLRTVYPRRHPKFVVAFSVAVSASAGVAPLVISNPMNLIFAEHAGIDFNRYSITMIPVALAGAIVAYAVLAWLFREPLSDPAPALGAWPTPPAALSRGARVVLATVVAVLCAYPVMSYLDAPLWPVAAIGGCVCAAIQLAAGDSPRTIAGAISWPIFPFLIGVFVLAIGLERAGAVDWLRALYASSQHPIATIGTTSAIGSAILNNHPMSVLNAFALDGGPDPGRTRAFAALIGGDLGPRLLPVGSLASLLWYDLLRRHGVAVPMTTFVRVGVALTVPTLAISLLVLAALAR